MYFDRCYVSIFAEKLLIYQHRLIAIFFFKIIISGTNLAEIQQIVKILKTGTSEAIFILQLNSRLFIQFRTIYTHFFRLIIWKGYY